MENRTNKQQMYQFLCDLQGIQREAYDNGVNFEIGMRETNTSCPWLTVLAYLEPFNPEDERNHKYFYIYEYRNVEDNREVLHQITKFVAELVLYAEWKANKQ